MARNWTGALSLGAGAVALASSVSWAPEGWRRKQRGWTSSPAHCETSAVGRRCHDVLIVGGGIAGLSAALFAAEKGASVALLEKGTLACEASSLAAGTVLVNGPGEDLSAHLSYGTREIVLGLEAKYQVDPELTKCSALCVATNAKQVAYLEKMAGSLQKKGYKVHLLKEQQELVRAEPLLGGGNVKAALESPLSFHVNPNACSHAIGEAAEQHGAVLVEGAHVVSISEQGGEYLVETSTGKEYAARNLVVASGCDFSNTVGLCGSSTDVSVVPVKGQIWAVEPPEGMSGLRTMVFGVEVAMFSENNSTRNKQIPDQITHDRSMNRLAQHVYGRMTPEGQIIFGGDRILDFEKDYLVAEEQLQENYRHILQSVPSLREYPLAGSYVCYMPFSWDGLPLVGNIRPGLWALGGFGPHGISQAPKSAEILIKQILCPAELDERDKLALKAMDPNRPLL